MLNLAFLNAEIANGMYHKPFDVIAKEIHYELLAPDVREVIVRSWQNIGMLPPAAVEQMVPVRLDE
jgi:hypothetical protein